MVTLLVLHLPTPDLESHNITQDLILEVTGLALGQVHSITVVSQGNDVCNKDITIMARAVFRHQRTKSKHLGDNFWWLKDCIIVPNHNTVAYNCYKPKPCGHIQEYTK